MNSMQSKYLSPQIHRCCRSLRGAAPSLLAVGLRGWLRGSRTQQPQVRSEPDILVFPKGTNASPPPASALTYDLFETLICPSAAMDHAAELPHFLHWLQREPGDELRGRGVPVRGDKSCTSHGRGPYSTPSSVWGCPGCTLKRVLLHPGMVSPR